LITNDTDWAAQQATEPQAGDFIHTIYREFSREHAFLIALLGRRHVGRQHLLEAWAPLIDWSRFQQIASPELFAYLGHVLTETGLLNCCPTSLQAQFRNRQRFTAAQWLRWRLELRHIVQVFRDHGIDLILLKGAVLSTVAYPATSLRSMSDIDLLVRPADAERALHLIEAAGFRCPDRFQFIDPDARPCAPANTEVSPPLQKIGTRAFVEVHTQLESAEPQYPVSEAELWRGAEEFELCGLPCKTLEKHEFLLHLIMHLSEHHLFAHGLRAMLDVHLWIELHDGKWDWNWIAAQAARRGYAQWVSLSLRLVQDMFATPVPAAVFTLGTPAELGTMQQLAYEQIFAEGRAVGNTPEFLIFALAQPSIAGAARLIMRRLIPNRAAMRFDRVRSLSRPGFSGVRLAARRVLRDLCTRLPQYYRAWCAGRLRWNSLRRAASLERRAGQLRDLMQRQAGAGPASG
jgi:hypothetical protein